MGLITDLKGKKWDWKKPAVKTGNKRDFLRYLTLQQGGDYITEQQYKQMPFETIKELESDSYNDFKKERAKKSWKTDWAKEKLRGR